MLEVTTVDRAAWFAPLSADPAAYLETAMKISEQMYASVGASADQVDRFLAAREAAFGRTEVGDA